MIGFSIMMWFVGIVLCLVAVSLLKGNSASMHGKVYEMTSDREGYARTSGRAVLLLGVGIICSGFAGLITPAKVGITVAMILLIGFILITAIYFVKIQKKYGQLTEKTGQN